MSYIGIDPSAIAQPGTVLQVQKAITEGIQLINSASMAEINGLIIDFTPKSANSTIILEAMISTSDTHVTSFGFWKDNVTMRTVSVSNNNGTDNLVTSYHSANGSATDDIRQIFLLDYETNTSTTTREYAIRCMASWSTTNYNLYINDRGNDDMASFSTFTIWEVQN